MRASHERSRQEIEAAVALVFGVRTRDLRSRQRGRQMTAGARQAAMYLAHVGLGLTLSEVGRIFGRDRTTVAHACAVIEDRREEVGFDLAMQCLEGIVRSLLRRRGLASQQLPAA